MIFSSFNMFILHTCDIHILLSLVIDVSCCFFNVSVANTIAYASLVTEHSFLVLIFVIVSLY